MNRVCSIHEVYCPDGKCKWCEEPAAGPEGLASGAALSLTGSTGSIWSEPEAAPSFMGVPVATFVAVMPRPEPDRAVTLQIGPASGASWLIQQQAAGAQGLGAAMCACGRPLHAFSVRYDHSSNWTCLGPESVG